MSTTKNKLTIFYFIFLFCENPQTVYFSISNFWYKLTQPSTQLHHSRIFNKHYRKQSDTGCNIVWDTVGKVVSYGVKPITHCPQYNMNFSIQTKPPRLEQMQWSVFFYKQYILVLYCIVYISILMWRLRLYLGQCWVG